MKQHKRTGVAVQVNVNAPLEMVWESWVTPSDIMCWNAASSDWHTTKVENNLWPGGTFRYLMKAKDGSQGFFFEGIYTKVILHKQIDYTIGDGREVIIAFAGANDHTSVIETFEAEDVHPVDLQRKGWQAILDNFKKYVEMKHGVSLANEKEAYSEECG